MNASPSGSEKMRTGKLAVEWLELSRAKHAGPPDREADYGDLLRMAEIAPAALEAGDTERAERYAHVVLRAASRNDERVQSGGLHGDLAYLAHIVLGKIAVRKGDLEDGSRHLLAAARAAKPSPRITTLGPDTQLPAEILRAGDRDSVIAYFEAMRGVWRLGRRQLSDWITDLRAGKTPDFGPERTLKRGRERPE